MLPSLPGPMSARKTLLQTPAPLRNLMNVPSWPTAVGLVMEKVLFTEAKNGPASWMQAILIRWDSQGVLIGDCIRAGPAQTLRV